MARYAGSEWKPVESHGGAMTVQKGLILHCTTNDSSPYGFFSRPSNQASSQWWVSADGKGEQYVDTDFKAWAQSNGNGTYLSVESSGVPENPLTAAQVEWIAGLYAWGHTTFGWPFALAETPGDSGLGWHGMGGSAWGGHTACPGDLRKNQRQAILDRAAQIINPSQEDIVASIEDLRTVVQQELAKAVATLHAEHVLILHGDKTHPISLDSIYKEVTK